MRDMTVGAYFLALRQEHTTDQGRRVSQSWVAQQVSALLNQTVHASTIGRIEKGGGLSWEYFTALIDVLHGDMEDVRWMRAGKVTPEQAKARARETIKRTLNSPASHRAAVESLWQAEASTMTDEELAKELANVQARKGKKP